MIRNFFNRHKDVLIIIAVTLISSFILYFPFIFKFTDWFGLVFKNSSMDYIYRHFDGLFYVVVAKTLYNPQLIKELGIEIPLSTGYFAAHLPLYPIFIKILAPLLGFLKSMIVVNLVFSVVLAVFFHYFLKVFKLSVNPLLLTIVFLFLPRFLVVRSIGSPESLFILLILISIFFFEKEKYIWAGVFGALSVMTKTPGMLLFVAYGLVLIERLIKTHKIEWKAYGIGLIPLGLVVVFLLHLAQYGDFFAYFHSGDNIHLVFPYSVFNFQKTWIGSGWLEDILFYFFMYLMTIFVLKDSKHRSFFYFTLVFFVATVFVQHRDIARYSLPMWPLACIALDKFFTSRRVIIAFLILLPGIILYAWNFLGYNVLEVADWKAFL